MNKVFLIGRLAKDVELRYTTSGTAYGSFNLAVNRDYTNEQGKREADFINIVVWRKQAENCSKYIGKGSQIAVDGKISTRKYQTQNGDTRYITEVVAENVQFLDSKSNSNANTMQYTADETQNQNMQTHNEVQDPFAEMGDIVQKDNSDMELPF